MRMGLLGRNTLLVVVLLGMASHTLAQRSTPTPSPTNGTGIVLSDTHLIFNLPHCPELIPYNTLQSPSTFFFFMLASLTALFLCLLVTCFYNHIRLPHVDAKIRTRTISNSMWILYFAGVFLRSLINAVRYGKPSDIITSAGATFVYHMNVTCMVLHGITGFCLTLALGYQYRYRCKMPLNPQTVAIETFRSCNDEQDAYSEDELDEDEDEEELKTQVENKGLITKQPSPSIEETKKESAFKTFLSYLFSMEFVGAFCLILFILSTALRANSVDDRNTEAFKWFQFSTVVLQRVPIFILSLLIMFSSRSSGPKITARIILFVAVVLNLANDMPMTYWHMFLQTSLCVYYVASVYDTFVILYWLSLLSWFVFLRAEYVRSQEETMFTAFVQSQNSFEQKI
ncbi:MLP2 [Acrasis kona]|uniref:MLP2 n=1 Tax=Acrasis kona TaxID=1008807 RepID=A0AAW2ZN20_9EUKA